VPDDDVPPSQAITRRQLIRRSAVVGGTVEWTAPVIQTETPAAEPADAAHNSIPVEGVGGTLTPESS
jgi:hypothetical protein